jgi:hypothetical protein
MVWVPFQFAGRSSEYINCSDVAPAQVRVGGTIDWQRATRRFDRFVAAPICLNDLPERSAQESALDKPVCRQARDGNRDCRPQPLPTGRDQIFDHRKQQNHEYHLPDLHAQIE